MFRLGLGALLCLGGVIGCSASSDLGDPMANPPGAGGTGPATGGVGGGVPIGGANASGGSVGFMTGTGGDGGGSNPDECEAVRQKAEKQEGGRADIIFIIDNSGSMQEEAIAVQNNMNAFSQQIAASGIDAHVVVISAPPPGGAAPCTNALDLACWIQLFASWGDANGVCVDAPLGLPGVCPTGDSSNPAGGYLHVMQEVGSRNSLALLQSTFPQWQSMLRPDAAKTFVVVTDDENRGPPTGPEFANWVNAQPEFQQAVWRFSGVFCAQAAANCFNVGATYAELVSQTGGVSGDLASFQAGDLNSVNTEFASVFDSLAQAIVADAEPVDCEWDIPEPPEGQTLDPKKVNVNYTPSGGMPQTIYAVASAAECSADLGGWFYDNPAQPARVIACPESCAVMQADDGAAVDVLFGCEQIKVPR